MGGGRMNVTHHFCVATKEKCLMKTLKIITLASLALLVAVSGCAPTTTVKRMDERTIIDLSGEWNDADSQMVADEMIVQCLEHPWRDQFVNRTGKLPVVIVGTIFNKTDEHIDDDLFIHDLERELINRNDVRFVSAGAMRDELRAERQSQQDFASADTVKRLREELGADFMLQGTIGKIVDVEGKQKVNFYQVDLILTDLETTEKVWIGQKKIKKLVEKSRLGF
jgi:penicillin-binding protein activator